MQSILQYRRLRPQIIQPSSPQLKEKNEEPNDRDENSSSPGTDNEGEAEFYILVDWDGPLDPTHPRNWPYSYKVWVCTTVFINVFVLDWCSSADSQTSSKWAAEFGVGGAAESVSSAMYVLGIAAGALFSGPISETVGRNPIYIGSRIFHLAFLLGTALAPNLGAQISFRFLAGFGASIILAIHGASVADLFGPKGRSSAWPFVALSSFLGTSFSPVAGGWIEQSSISFRWADWIAFILSAITLIVSFFWLPETFAPILLKWKASRTRQITGNSQYRSEIELQSSFRKRLGANFYRSFIMSTREYTVILLGLWLVLVYIVIFCFLQGFDYLFMDTYNFSRGLTGTSFVAISVGAILNIALTPLTAHYHHRREQKWKSQHNQNEQLPPEYRMIPALPVAFTFPISIFWLGWTNYASISPFSGLAAAVLFGFSWAGIYVAIYQYILDVYGIYAGSALATITAARYLCAGAIQMISRPMWSNLGTHWTCTLLGGLATLLIPVPFIFFYFGNRIRKISRFASEKMGSDRAEKGSETKTSPV